MDVVIATGDSASESIAQFAGVIKIQPPEAESIRPKPGQALIWLRKESKKMIPIKIHITKKRASPSPPVVC